MNKNSKLHVCIDFRDLNNATTKDEYHMPVANMLVDSTSGNKILSFMDLWLQSSCYCKRRCVEDDISMSRGSWQLWIGRHAFWIEEC